MLGVFVYTLGDVVAVGALGCLALGFGGLYLYEVLRKWRQRRR